MGRPPKNPPSLSSGAADDHLNNLQKPKKHPGRPKGSKNKPKPQPLFSANNAPSLKSSIDVINIPSGADITEWLCQYSRTRQKSITVLSASGLVSEVSIRDLLNSSQHTIFIPGPVPALSLSGSITVETTSSSSSPLVICVPGCEGQIVYGYIEGSVVATSTITIVIETTEIKNSNNSGNKIEFNNYMMDGDHEHEADNNKPNAVFCGIEDYVVHPALALQSGSLPLGDVLDFLY